MMTIKCARCDASMEVNVKYEIGRGLKLDLPAGWLQLSHVMPWKFACPECPAITRFDVTVSEPLPEEDEKKSKEVYDA